MPLRAIFRSRPGKRRIEHVSTLRDPRAATIGATMTEPFIRRVRLKNYKSLQACDVELDRLTFLVGPNGAGKSNFVDALRFVSEALRVNLEFAVAERGGIDEVRRRTRGNRGGHPPNFGVALDFTLRGGSTGTYAFDVSAGQGGTYAVQREECTVHAPKLLEPDATFRVVQGKVETNLDVRLPQPSSDRLYLFAASALPEFRAVFDALTHMGFYNLNPAVLREPQKADPGDLLKRDGANIASVIAHLERSHPDVKRRIEDYLSAVVPGVRGVRRIAVGHLETLEFHQQAEGDRSALKFPAVSMSDGTLRALGVLVALLQHGNGDGRAATLIGIEEPEIALHPAASGVLLDVLSEASENVQVIVTSHSPDLLDGDSIPTSSLRAVTSEAGRTVIGPVDTAAREVLRDHLFTPGELLRLDQLHPRRAAYESAAKQLDLFST